MRNRIEEFIVLSSKRPKHYPVNPYTGSSSMCKYRMMRFIYVSSPKKPLGLQFRRLKNKYRYVVKAMNLYSVRTYGLWDL